jgi:hypothetical protein
MNCSTFREFGSSGDLILQKSILVKPIQDQVFTAVQDIAEAKNMILFSTNLPT